MKKCTKCQKEKTLDMFKTRKSRAKAAGAPIVRSHCKACESKDQSKRNKIRMQTDSEFRAKSLKQVEEWGKKNKKRRLEADAKRRRTKYQENLKYRSKVISQAASYRSKKLFAQPSWLSEKDLKRIKNIYEVCAKLSKTTGKPHDVDHIVPLQGKNICGLHVPWNLAILPASMNRSKGNAHPSSIDIS